MDYFNRIQHAIEFIESNLQEELNIIEISSKSYFSAFHFQRLFHAITGFSVQEYIRSRRLSEAARLLKEKKKNILEIAISFQYGSQEAFTRAFVNRFGITPAKYRKEEMKIREQKKINFLDYKNKTNENLYLNKPEIIMLEKIQITGYQYYTTLINEDYFDDIPKYYIEFGEKEHYLRIPNRISPNMAYGISADFNNNGQFSFIVGEEVHKFNSDLEKGFVNIEIPEGKYALFTVNGTSDLIQNTRRYIYGTWLPNSNYERKEGPDFEITDVLRSTYPNDMKMKIYIPIEK